MNPSPDQDGKEWTTVTHINFTVGVQGLLHEKSSTAALITLGVTSRRAQSRIRKATVRRMPGVDDLILKCYHIIGRAMEILSGVPSD